MSQKKESISIALIDIIDREVYVKEPNEKFKKNFNKDSLQLVININFSTPEKENNLILNIAVKYEYPHEEEKIELLRSAFNFQFEISHLDKIITFDEDKIDIPDGLAMNLVSVSLSTIRGLIAAKTRGYFINKYYFPIINPKELTGLFTTNNNEESKMRA